MSNMQLPALRKPLCLVLIVTSKGDRQVCTSWTENKKIFLEFESKYCYSSHVHERGYKHKYTIHQQVVKGLKWLRMEHNDREF
jgi:hypothetical protein